MLLTLKFNVVAPKPHSCTQFFLYRSKAGLSKVGNNYESIRRIFGNYSGLGNSTAHISRNGLMGLACTRIHSKCITNREQKLAQITNG